MFKNKKAQEFGLSLAVLLVIGVVIYLWVIPEPKPEECKIRIEETPIYSLDMNDNLMGSFFIGIGSFNERTYYYYFKYEDGGKILEKRRAEYTRIIEDDNKAPALIKYLNSNVLKCPIQDTHKTTLRVPSNTIKQTYNLDVSER